MERLFTSLIIAIIISILLIFILFSKLVEIQYLSFLLSRILPILSLICIFLAVLLYMVSLIIGNKTKEKVKQLASQLFWAGIILFLTIGISFFFGIVFIP